MMYIKTDKEKKLTNMYDLISLGNSEICTKCRQENPKLYEKAVGAWFVGYNFDSNKNRVLFVGKNARGLPGAELKENKKNQAFLEEWEYSRLKLWNKNWAYWSYTKLFCELMFDGGGMENIAFTNIIKCNSSPNTDTTTVSMKNYCIKELKTLKKEVEIIKPTHIIFYLGRDYDLWIRHVFSEFQIITDTTRKIGKKIMPWGEYDTNINENKIHVLRVGHPERKKKFEYVNALAEWVNSTSCQ